MTNKKAGARPALSLNIKQTDSRVFHPLHVAQVQLKRYHRNLNLVERDGERDGHEQQADDEDDLAGVHPAGEQHAHAHDAQQQARRAEELHVADQHHAVAQVVDLLRDQRIVFVFVAVAQVANDRGQPPEIDWCRPAG